VKYARTVTRQMWSCEEATSWPVGPYRSLTAARCTATAVDLARSRFPPQVPRAAALSRPWVYERAATGPAGPATDARAKYWPDFCQPRSRSPTGYRRRTCPVGTLTSALRHRGFADGPRAVG
jgi:hypothetical protein